jgi:hypothetical protein
VLGLDVLQLKETNLDRYLICHFRCQAIREMAAETDSKRLLWRYTFSLYMTYCYLLALVFVELSVLWYALLME